MTTLPPPATDGSPDAEIGAAGGFLRRLLRAPRLLLLLTLLLGIAGALGFTKLRNEEDILVFLPEGDAEVSTFKEVASRFGALRVALIGVQPRGGELFTTDLLGRIGQLSTALKNTVGVDRVVSLSTLTDFRPSDFGVDVVPLLPDPLPTESAQLAALKAHVLTLPQVRGNAVSGDGRAGLIMVFFAEGAKTRPLADTCRALAREHLGPAANLYFGGAPFAGQAIYDDTQKDVARLTPLALVLFFFVVLLAFWDALPVLLTVGTVGLSGVMVVGGMGLWGEPFTVVTGTLPLILFASGSQYSIHVLGRYYLLRTEHPPLEAAREALRIAGPPVLIAALNCCLGFLSFSVMNIRAMRTFGYACSIGVLLCFVLSVTVLPSVVARWQRGQGTGSAGGSHVRFTRLGGVMWAIFRFARRHRVPVALGAFVLAAASGGFMTRVQVRMEPRAFFRPGSEPAEAQRFLDSELGGGQFVQILLEGELTDPRALAEVRRLGAFARALPGVTQIQSIVQPLALVSEGMAGQRGLPETQAQAGTLLSLMEGEPSLRALISPDRKSVLLHARVLGEAQPVIVALRAYLTQRWPFTLRAPSRAELAEEALWLLPDTADARAEHRREVDKVLSRVAVEIKNLDAEPPPVPPPGTSEADAEAAATAAEDAALAKRKALLATGARKLLLALGRDPDSKAPQAVTGRSAEEIQAEAEMILEDLRRTVARTSTPAATPPPPALTARITGEPMLDQAFSRAVDRNQWASLGLALGAVLVVLLLAQRSLWSALLSILPAGMSLLVVFGVLGLSGRPIDLGTSLVGSIVTSSGADFAMHYIWYLRRNNAEEAVRTVGPVIFVTAVLLGLGMGVLMLGAAPPIRLFGGLSCAGMLLSAAFTFLLVPALLGRLPGERPAR